MCRNMRAEHTYTYTFHNIKHTQEYDEQAIPWYQPNGERSIQRHPCNMRNNIGHLRKLYASVKLRSLSYQVRGNPWLVTSAVGMFTLLAIAWGSLITAVYDFIESEPNHPNAIKLKAEGLKNAVVFTHRTPTTVLVWLKGYHNEFHDGHKPSVFDWLEDTLFISTRIDHNVASRQVSRHMIVY